jgi:hypothetical protein
MLPAVVLGVVYSYAYNAGRSSGIGISSAMPEITSVPMSTPPASITPKPGTPKVIETPEIQSSMVKRIRQTSEGLVVDNRSVQALPSVPPSDKVVFRTPNVSGNPSGTSESIPESELQPLKLTSVPETLPPLAKPQAAPQDKDCGCGK